MLSYYKLMCMCIWWHWTECVNDHFNCWRSEMLFRLRVTCAHTPAQSAFVKLEILIILNMWSHRQRTNCLSAKHIIFHLHMVPFFFFFFGIFNHILIPVKPKIKVPQIPVSSWETVKCRVNLSLGAEHFLGRYWDKTLDGCQSSLTSNLNDLKRPQVHKIHGGVSLNQQTPFLFQIFICPEKTKKTLLTLKCVLHLLSLEKKNKCLTCK